jgi:hypothetical protein
VKQIDRKGQTLRSALTRQEGFGGDHQMAIKRSVLRFPLLCFRCPRFNERLADPPVEPHFFIDGPAAVVKRIRVTTLRFREHAPDQVLEHVQGLIGKRHRQLEYQGGECGAATKWFQLRQVLDRALASLMAALAEFERDLLRERVRSGIAAAQKRGVVFGRRLGQGGQVRT